MSEPEEAPAGSQRRQELLHKTLEYAAEHNLSDLSLRPLAAAIGTSPRVLLYLFGSKENLLREVTAAERRHQVEVFAGAAEADDPHAALELLWQWITDADRANLSRLFFENYVRSLDGTPGFEGHAEASVAAWLGPLGALFDGADQAAATLALAVMRGLVLDLLATGDRERIDGAWRLFRESLRPEPDGRRGSRLEQSEPGPAGRATC